MWWLFQVLIMTLIIGSNGAYHWAGENSGSVSIITIDAQHNGLAIDHELLDAVLQGALGDPGIALRPVIAPGDQADTIAVTLKAEAEAVVLDFVKPFRPGRLPSSAGRTQTP